MFLTPFSSFKRRRTQSNELDELWTSIEYQKLAQEKLNCEQVYNLTITHSLLNNLNHLFIKNDRADEAE